MKDRTKNTPQVLLRRALLVLLDAAIVAFSFYFALLLRADGAVEAGWWPHNRALLYENLPWIVAVYIVCFLAGGLYSVLWKYAGERDLLRLAVIVAVPTGIVYVVNRRCIHGVLFNSANCMAAVLILLGIYGMLFYRYVFPSRLKKAAKKQYAGNPYLQNEVEFRFFEDAFREISAETDNTVDWEEVQRILYTDHLIVLMLANRRCVIIPRTSIRNFDTEFLKYLERQIHHHGITALHKESAAR